MAQEYDVVLKLLFRSQSNRAVQEIAGGPVKRWLDKELPAIRNTRADLLGETPCGEFIHLEFMSRNQKFIELRMAGYYVEIYQACGSHPHLRKAIRRILATIATLDARAREEALGQLMVICGLRGIERDVEEEIKKVPVLNSLLDHKVLGREFKKGLEQGEAKGEAKLLRRQLEHRFRKLPKWVDAKIADATPAQLEEWGERLLDEKSLEAIFGRN